MHAAEAGFSLQNITPACEVGKTASLGCSEKKAKSGRVLNQTAHIRIKASSMRTMQKMTVSRSASQTVAQQAGQQM